MKVEKIGSGTTIDIEIPLEKAVSEYSNVFASLYTTPGNPVRFSYVEKEGFNKLTVGSENNILVGSLKSDQSAKMKGCLMMELKAIEGIGDAEDAGNSIPVFTTIELVDNTLKSTK